MRTTAHAHDSAHLSVRIAKLATRALATAAALLPGGSFGSAAALRQDADGQRWRWVDLELELWIEPEPRELHLEGRGTLALEGGPSDGPTLEWNAELLELAHIEAAGASVDSSAPPEPATGADAGLGRAHLRFPAPKQPGARVAVEFEFQGKGRSDQFDVQRSAALASWVESWYPAPAGPASLSARLAAPGLTRFHLPEGWHSVSNGEPEPGAESDVETWRVTQPVARSFACAPFTTVALDVDGREVGIHRLSGTARPDVELAAVASILRTLEARYGPYPYPAYRVVEVPLGVGNFLGSSEQGFILVRPVAFEAPDGNLALFAHELAHGWWGNRVASQGPGSVLLSEGLAQFSAAVAIEAIEGEAAATEFLRFSRPGYVEDQCARGYFQSLLRSADQPLSTLEGGDLAHQLADSKGHWVLAMLRRRIGDERFFAALGGIARDFGTRTLTLPEFRERFERAAPDAGLRRFFAEWLDRSGAPVLEVDWRSEEGRVLLSVRQLQSGDPYHLPLEIALDSEAGRAVHAVELGLREQRFELASAAPVTAVALDPSHKLLIWTEDYGPRPTR